MRNTVSIIIPVYNVEHYLCNTIDSVLSQTYKNIEIILVNDGSTDKSGEICDLYAERDSKVKCYHLENKGVSFARNYGMNKANGEFIMFVDSDDTIEVDTIYKVVRTLLSDDSDIALFGMKFEYIKNGICYKSVKKSIEKSMVLNSNNFSDSFFDLFSHNYLSSACNKIFKRKIVEENNIKFNPEISKFEDLLFSLELLKYCKSMSILPNPFYLYANREGISLSKKYEKGLFDKLYVVIDYLDKYTTFLGLEDDFSKKRINGFYVYLVSLCISNLLHENRSTNDKVNYIKKLLEKEEVAKIINSDSGSSTFNKVFVYFTKKKMYRMIYILFLLKYQYKK